MIRCNRLVLGMLIAFSAPLCAELRDADSRERAKLPDRPADHILDVGGILDRFPDRRAAISARLMALQADHDLPVYVVIYGTLIDSNPQRRARLFHDRWIGSKCDGLVVLYEADTLHCEIVTPGSHYSNPAMAPGSLSRLPDHRMIKIRASLSVTLEGVEDRLDYLDRTIEILTEQLDALLREEALGADNWPTMQFTVTLLVVGVVIALLGIAGTRRLRRAEDRVQARYYFPDVMVGTRLGAPYAGGRQSVVDFSREGPPRS